MNGWACTDNIFNVEYRRYVKEIWAALHATNVDMRTTTNANT